MRNPAKLDFMPTNSAPSLIEDCNPAEPTTNSILPCIFADFPAGSYTVGVLLDSIERSGGDQNDGQFQAGLAIVYDYDDYLEASLLSQTSHGNLYMVSTLAFGVDRFLVCYDYIRTSVVKTFIDLGTSLPNCSILHYYLGHFDFYFAGTILPSQRWRFLDGSKSRWKHPRRHRGRRFPCG